MEVCFIHSIDLFIYLYIITYYTVFGEGDIVPRYYNDLVYIIYVSLCMYVDFIYELYNHNYTYTFHNDLYSLK